MLNGSVGKLVTPVDCKSAAPGTAGSTPATSTKQWRLLLSVYINVTAAIYCSVSSIGRARHCHCRGKRIETAMGRQFYILLDYRLDQQPFKL